MKDQAFIKPKGNKEHLQCVQITFLKGKEGKELEKEGRGSKGREIIEFSTLKSYQY